MSTALDRLDPMTMHGLVRAFMSAYIEDAIDAKNCAVNGCTWDPENSRGKQLERSICMLSQCIDKAMSSGSLSPFNLDYVEWLAGLGLISPRNKDVPNEKR